MMPAPTDRTIMVACPTCKKAVPWLAEQTFKPFCSERCKLIDLGDWASEAHKIPGQQSQINRNNDTDGTAF